MFGAIDRLLRGQFTDADALRKGRIEVPIPALVVACLLLGAIYGASMGLFSVTTRPSGEGWIQICASMVKVPLLFLSTLVVTFPSLYVVSALARSRLKGTDTLRLLLASTAVNLAMLASLSPVAAFFTFSTDSYAFIKLLHIAFFAVSGLVGLSFLLRSLRVILEPESTFEPEPTEMEEVIDETEDVVSGYVPLPPSTYSRKPHGAASGVDRAVGVFRAWIVIYGVVGAQMGWIMRPFIGDPSMEFTWFRERASNFLAAFTRAFVEAFGG